MIKKSIEKIFLRISNIFILILLLLFISIAFIQIPDYVEANGILIPEKYYAIIAPSNGNITSLFVLKEQQINSGDIILKQTSNDLEIARNQTQLQHDYLKNEVTRLINYYELIKSKYDKNKKEEEKNLNKIKKLYEEGFKSKTEYETQVLKYNNFVYDNEINLSEISGRLNTTQFELEKQKIELLRLSNILDKSEIRAPISGNLIIQLPEPLINRYIKEGEIIGFVYEEGKMIATIKIPDNKMTKINTGLDVFININAFPKENYKIFKGTIKYISQNAQEGFYTIHVYLDSDIVTIKDNNGNLLDKKLMIGLSLKAKIKVGTISLLKLLFNISKN